MVGALPDDLHQKLVEDDLENIVNFENQNTPRPVAIWLQG